MMSKNIIPPKFNPRFPNHPSLTLGYDYLDDRDIAIKEFRAKGYNYIFEYRDVRCPIALIVMMTEIRK
jgi:hypothetical protein